MGVKWVPVLDERLRIRVRTTQETFSVIELWRRLVACADFYIMLPIRRQDPSEAERWRLKHIVKRDGMKEGPTYAIVRVRDEPAILASN